MLGHEEPQYHYPTTADAYDVFAEIGIGAFATVYRAQVKETGEEVAIKVMDLEQFNANWEEVRREIEVMVSSHHPNVVRILTSFVDEQDLWIVMPLLQAGSCASIMKQIYPTGMKDEALVATILKEVLLGLCYIHKNGRIHRDLKAGNILVSNQGEVQLADFGVAGTLLEHGDRKKSVKTFTGTPCWMAPEVMEHNNSSGYDEKADIWSFGITAMELAFGRAPYAKFQPMKVMLLTLSEEPPTCEIYKDNSYEFSSAFHEMISKCLRKDASKRRNAKKLLEHKFFKKAKDKAYIIEKIVKKLPPRPETKEKIHICKEKTVTDAQKIEKSKPVSVGSWVFDKDEFEEFKRLEREREEKEGTLYDNENGQPNPASYPSHVDPNNYASPQNGVLPDNFARIPAGHHESSDDADSPPTPSSPHTPDGQPNSRFRVDINASTFEAPDGQTPVAEDGNVTEQPHQEGRFLVSEDSVERFDNQTQDGAPVEEVNQLSLSDHNLGFPVFHNGVSQSAGGVDQDGNETVDVVNESGDGERHVGRFAIIDDEN